MFDLLIGIGSISAGITGLALIHRAWFKTFPALNADRAELAAMTPLELHVELTRCCGAIIACGRKGDKRGVRCAIRRIWLVSEAMLARAKKNRPQLQLRTAQR